jgi:hypothetical protein
VERIEGPTLPGRVEGMVVLIQKNGDCEVEASFTENEVASSNASGLTYCNIEWKQQPDIRRK